MFSFPLLVSPGQAAELKIEFRQLEDDMLLRLSAAMGSFLDNCKLVEKLESTESTAAEIQHRVITIELFLTS